MPNNTLPFPIVDALLLTPKEADSGALGICTNTSAPGQVYNEIEEEQRPFVSVIGSLIVSRDGTERMILNTLAHPSVRYIILFSEESLTFSPSTNLLLALQNGVNFEASGNYIKDGKAASAHYPNLSAKIIDAFRENITVIPLFMYRNDYSRPVVLEYLEWLRPKINDEIYEFLKETTTKKSIYYDSLNALIALLSKLPKKDKPFIDLDPKEFQHLQPPKIELSAEDLTVSVPFKVSKEKELIRLDIAIEDKTYYLKGKSEFLMEYSLMKFIGDDKKFISPLEQLLLGAELARVDTEIKNKIEIKTRVHYADITGAIEIPLESNTSLITDKRFYYKVSVREQDISVMCLAFDVCEEVFELRSPTNGAIFNWLAEKNRFEEYEMDILHRMDVGGQIGRAGIAAKLGFAFIQDFSSIFRINTEELPLLISQGDSFLEIHKNILMKIYTEGLTEEHGDKQKGLARTGIALAIYRDSKNALASLPAFYKQGDQSTEEMRLNYKKQLLRFDHDGDYSYGQRTRAHFGFDQLPKTIEILKSNPNHATVIQRFDPTVDMGSHIVPETGKLKYTHDPCLTHDIFIVHGGKLHSFHIARAHNTVNAYPENIFGLFDAYVTTIREELGVKSGDMYMLSNRANILLLTEEQRTKKILTEPSKPSDDMDTASGPYEVGEDLEKVDVEGVVAYRFIELQERLEKPTSESGKKIISRLENFEGIDTIERAVSYYESKGVMHNNPVLTEYQAGQHSTQNNPQADQLIFFQANTMGGKLHATAVFANRSLKNINDDTETINYLSTLFSKRLKVPLGHLSLFYVGYTK